MSWDPLTETIATQLWDAYILALRAREIVVVKVVVAKLASKKGKRRRAVAKRRTLRPDGRFVDQFWVDLNSKTFADDLISVFVDNVERARQANTAIFGSPDGIRRNPEKMKRPGSADAHPKK